MAQGDSRKLEQVLGQMEDRVRQIRNSLRELLVSFEQGDRVSYQDTINKYASLMAEYSAIQTMLKKPAMIGAGNDENSQLLKSHIIVPKQLSTAPDPGLQNMTEGRLIICDPEVIATMLNLRLNPEQEEEERKIEQERASRAADHTFKQIQTFNRHLDSLISKLHDSTRQVTIVQSSPSTYSNRDTDILVRAINRGIGIRAKSAVTVPPQPTPSQQQPAQPQQAVASAAADAAQSSAGGPHPNVKLK